MNIEEGTFWKEIVQSMCHHFGINANLFLEKLGPLRDVWKIEDSHLVLKRIQEMQKGKSLMIRNNISSILRELNEENDTCC